MPRYIIFYVLLTLFMITKAHSQSGKQLHDNVYVKKITSEDDLSQSNVTSITKDYEGYLWIGTHDGLNRFDGYDFQIYHKSVNDTTQLSDDHILTIYEDSKKRLWIGTHLGGLNLYDRHQDTFTHYENIPGDHQSLSQNTVQSIVETPDGNLWLATLYGLNEFNPETGEFKRYLEKQDGSGIANNETKSLILNEDSTRLWIATNFGLSLMDLETKEFQNFYYDPDNPKNSASKENMTSICRDHEGNIWIGTSGDGLQKYTPSLNQFRTYKTTDDPNSIRSNIVQKVYADKNGEILVGTDGGGINIYNPDGDDFLRINSRNDLSLSNAAIYEIYVDDDGILWTGVYGDGVKIIYRQQKGFMHYETLDKTMLELGKNSILAIAEDHDQNIWIGTDGAGLYRYNPTTGEFKAYLHDPKNPNSISGNVVKSLLVDDKGNLYAGTYAAGLNYINLKTDEITHYFPKDKNPHSLGAYHVWSLFQDSENRIWVGLLGGLQEFIPSESKFINYEVDPTDPTALSANFVSKIFEDSRQNLWIGTEEGGVNRLNKKDSTFVRYTHQDGKAGLSHNHIEDIFEDKNGRLWVGTNGGGLNYFDYENDMFLQYETTDVIGDAAISILEDDNGNFWIGTYKGLCKLNYQNDFAKCYTKIDGIQGNEFNSNAKLKSSDGKFYFGGLNGLNIFEPDNIIESDKSYPIVITDFYLFHKKATPRSNPELLEREINYVNELTLKPNQDVITIWFSALEYHFPKKNNYAYKLEGFDQDYNYVQDQRNATYTNLPAGNYTFKVISSNNDGVWKEVPKTLNIKVLPPWYQNPFVLGLFIILLVVVFFAIVKIRTKIYINQKRRLEVEVKRRTFQIELQKSEIELKNKKLENQNEELLAKNEEIVLQREQIAEKNNLLSKAHQEIKKANEELKKTNVDLENIVDQRTKELRETIRELVKTDAELNTFLYRSSHDLRGPLATLVGLTNLAKLEIDEEKYHHYFNKISQSCTNMLGFLKKLNETNTLFKLDREVVKLNWSDILEEIGDELKKLDPENKVDKKIDFKIKEELYSDELIIKTIIYNLMENAIVFKGYTDSHVNLLLAFDGQHLIINVHDNGIGIDPKIEKRIFEMFFRGSEQSSGNGLGLFLVKKAVDVLDGEIAVTGERHGNTSFTVKIPIKITQSLDNKKSIKDWTKQYGTIFR